MEIFLSAGLGPDLIRSLGRCRVAHEALFLSDLTTADGKYLEDFVFAPGRKERASTFKFPRKRPSWCNWESWFDFWHRFTMTDDMGQAQGSIRTLDQPYTPYMEMVLQSRHR
jgi:hypothetical protein